MSLQEPIKEQPKTLTIRISLPAWTLGHWQTYNNARNSYFARERLALPEAQRDTYVSDPITGRYVGSLALVQAGVVHIEGLEELQRAVTAGAEGVTGLHIVAFIVENIGNKIEAALESPLDWKKSLSVSTSPNGNVRHS